MRYAEELAKRWLHFEQPVGRSWRADETYVKVQGGWMFLYRAVDERGRTVESYLSRTRDLSAAKAFFRKALKHHGEPRSITLDAFKPSHSALHRMGMRNEFNFRWANPVKIRSCKYLNNIVEQDHRLSVAPDDGAILVPHLSPIFLHAFLSCHILSERSSP